MRTGTDSFPPCEDRFVWHRREDKKMHVERYPQLVTAMVWASWFSMMLPRTVVTALLPTIEVEYQISHAEAGLLMTSYLYPYALMQIPAGALSDRLGRKRFIIIALMGSSLASFALAGRLGFLQMIGLRVMAGLFAGLWYAPSMSLLALSVGEKDRGKAVGLAFSGPPVSDTVIYLMVGMLGVERFGWRNYFLIYAFPGLLCAFVTGLLVKEVAWPRHSSPPTIKKRQPVGKALKSRTMSGILFHNVAVFLAMYGLRTFLPVYLVQVRGLAPSEASLLMVAYAASVIPSGPLIGYLVDRFGFGRPSLFSLVTLCLVVSALSVIPVGVPMVFFLLLWGLIGGWTVTAFSVLLTRIVPVETRGTFLGILNSSTFLGAATGPLILGYAADVGGFGAFFALASGMCLLAAAFAFPILKAHWASKT